MRIILFIVFYIATCVARIATAGDISRTMSGRSMRYFRQKSETARSGVAEMPVDDGIIRMINKRNKQSLLGNRIDGFPQTRRNYNLERVKRSLQKRTKRCAKNSDCKLTRRRSNYDIEQNISSNAASFPIWRVPESTVSAINFESTTIMEAEMNNRSLLTLERPPSQLENLNYGRAVNEAVFPIAERYPSSRGLFDINVSDKDSMLPKIANPKSEIKVDVLSPAFEGLGNKVPLPAYRPGIRANIASPNSSYPQGFQRHGVHRRNSANLASSNKRFLLVPVSRNIYVLKNVQENPRAGVDGIIPPKRYKLLEGDKDNATSAILSFKAHMHHDAKDVGRAYLQRGNHRLLDRNEYLYSTLDPRAPEETANPTENPASYPNFLYRGVSFQTHTDSIDATPEISDEQIFPPVPDYANVSVDVNLRGGIESYDSAGFLSSSSSDIPNYDVISKESANDGQLSVLSATKLDNEISLFQQDGGNYENPLKYGEFGIELTTADFRDTFDDNVYTPAAFEMYLTNNEEMFDVSQNLGDDSKFSTERIADEPVTDFIDNISTQYKFTNEDNVFFPNITYNFADNAEDLSNGEDIDKDSQEYGISIPDEYDNKKSIYSNNFDYDNRAIDEAVLGKTTNIDLFLNAGDYVTAASLFPSTDEWPLKKAQSNVENSRALLMAIKPLSSELQKLLNAVKLVNRSLSDVQSRLCDKKNVVRTERESEDRKAANIAKLTNKVEDSDLFTESFNSQSPEKRRIKLKNGSIAERDIKIRGKTSDLFLNKLTTLFHKRKSSISNSEVQSGRGNFLEKSKLNEREFPKSGERRRLPHSRFNRNLKSLMKNYGMRVKPIRQLIEPGLKRTKRTTTSIMRPSRLIKSNVSSEKNFSGGYARNHQGSDQMSRSIISPSNIQDQQRNVKRAMPSEISRSDKEKQITDPQFFKEATAYLDVLQLLGKTEKPHVEYATDVWSAQSLTESLPSLIFTTTEFSVSALTFLPYFTEESITTLSTIAEKKEAPEMTESSLYKYVTDFRDYIERNYTRYKDYEEITSEIMSLTESPVTWSAFTITMPTTLPLFYMTELTILPIDEAAILTTEKMTIISPFMITTEVTETPIVIPMIENFTTESMILTPFLEGITNITLKIKIPAATEAPIKETPMLIEVETVTEEETAESTSTLEIMRSLPVETDTSLYTFLTESLFKTIETELIIKITSPTVVPTTLTITKGFQTVTMESIFGKPFYSTTAIASSPTILERTKMILSTSTEVAITTLTLEEESPVTQIEKTITAEETATEIPTTVETETPTEVTLSTTKTSITATEISTSTETTRITEILKINKTAETPTSIETPTTSERSTSTEATTITETLTPTEILTTLKTSITKETTGAKTLMPEIRTTIETLTTTEISTSIETTIITEMSTINKTLITAKTPTALETPTASERPTSTEIITFTETVTPTEFLTTLTTLVTKGITSAKTLTSTETSIETEITTETSTTTEISMSTETTTITETLTTTGTSAFTETSTTSEIPTTSTTIAEITGITETSALTEIVTTIKIPTTKKTTSTEALTPTVVETLSTTETQMITETPTFTETSETTEITVISTTHITTEFITISENTTSSVATTASKEVFSTSVLTIFPTTFTSETATESTLISSITPTLAVTTSGKITVSTLKLTMTTLLETLITNATLSETAYTTISSTFTTTERSVITSFETAMSTTSLKVATTMPLSLITSTMLSETPSPTLSTILTEETTASSILTTSSLEMVQTTTILPISITESTMETFLTTSSIATYTTGNATVFSTTASIITTEIYESTSPVMNFTVTTPSITTIPITTPVIVDTGTTTYETSASVTSFLLTETTEGMTSPTREETKEYEEYYESTKEEIATVTSTTELTTEEYTTWITEVTITRERTTYLPSFTTPFFIRSTTETTPLAIETIALPTTTEETLSTEKIVTVTPVTTIEGISTFSEVTLIPTETSTMSVIETSSLVPTIAATTASLPEETVTEVTETSWIITTLLPTTERPEYSTILEAAVAVTLAPFSESILSILITLETPATTPEVISVLPKTISEEFTISITESPSIKYVTESSIISFIETTVHPVVSISTAITEETLEAETEYYLAKGPSYEEEYEEYEEYEGHDTEIPTGKWYYYDEYETTTKERTTATVKYTKLPEEKVKSPPFVTGTASYEIETSEFTRYSTPSEITTYVTSTEITTYVTSTARTFYTEEEVTSALETPASTIIENVTTIEARTEFTMSASEKTESTTWLSFGSTEEYTLPSSTTVRISTEPLEYLTIMPKYTAVERFTHIWRNITLPKFTTKPKKIPEIILEKTTASEGVSTETEVAEKLTSFFVSPALTTLTEKEAFEVHTTTMSTASLETEGIIKTGYEVTTLAMTEEETIVTPFITSEAELIFTTTSKTIGRDEQKEQLLQQLDELKKHEKELAEREERLKEQQKQWDIEKEKCKEIMHEKEEAKNITTLTPYITTSIMDFYSIGLTSIETATPYTVEEMYTTSYVTLFSEPLFAPPTITSPITSTTEKFITLPIVTFSETFEEASIALITTPTWYTTEEVYTATYTDIYKPFFTLSTLEFTSTTTPPILAIVTATEIKYDEEIERLKEKLRKKERELEEREKILREREKRLEKDIMEFEKYKEEFKKKITSVTSAKKSTILTSLSTPVPPTERTTVKVQLTTQKITEKKESRTTTTMVTSRPTEMKDIQEKKPTKYIPEEADTQKEEEIVTKRICLNVLENTTIPLDKRRNIVTRKICLPYYPEKTEEKRSVGQLSRRLLALQSTRKIRRPRWNVPSDIRCRRRVKETTRKIDNLQLSHHEWLNETTKPLRHFKGFTRIYGKMRKFPKKVAAITDMRENTTSYFKDKTSLYEQRILDHYENIFQPTATPMLDSKEYRKRNTFFEYDSISRKSNFPIDDKANVRKRDVSTIDNARFSRKSTANTSSQRTTPAIIEEDGFFTVNVLHLIYNEDKQTHEVVSAKPDEDELTAILSESNDGNYVTDFGEDRKIITPYEIEEEDNLKEDDDELADKTKKKMEDEDYIEDMIDNYMNYEEHETSTWTHNRRFLNDKGKNKRITENERKLLNQAWPTEKSTTFHLGGTQFWELDFVTEPSAVLRTTIDKSKTINVSITETTCFDVILKNERNDEVKSNISYHKRDVHRKNVSIEQRNANLRNVMRKNASRYELRTKLPRVPATKLKQKPHGSNYSKRNYDGRRAAKFNDFRRTGNEDSITGKSRKLCGVNANKLNREIVKRKDATDKRKKKQAAKSRMLRNINSHSLHNTDNCVANKKNKCKKMTTASPQMKKTHDKKSHGKVTHLNIIDYKHKSTSASHGRKIHNCLDCICDIANVINNIKSLLDRMSFPLDKIKALNCSEYKEIQDKIVISMESDVEEAREFPQPHYNVESLKGQKYIKLEELEDNFKNDLELDGDHDVVSLPGLNLNLPCNQDGDGITWLSSAIRPSYTWKRRDGVALFGFVAENGDLELRNVNAKDTGNYTCVVTYMSPDNEEPVEATYEIHLQVVTLPRYVVHGEGRYHVRSCDERDLDILVTYLPLKLNSVICETDICNAYVLAPSCSQNQITVNILLVPSHIVKLMTIDSKHCNVFCLKAIQDKLSLVLSKNLQIFLGKIIIFRLPHYEQRLVPIAEESSFTRRKRGKIDANASVGRASNVGVFSSCPAGYGLRDTRCVPCNMGTYSEDGISHCKRCPPGTYQPNHGARVCRTCTNPMTKGCYNMLWNSFSAVMVTLASVGVMVLICLLLLWIICCAKKKFCVKRIAGIVAKEDAFEPEKRVEEQPLIKDASENEDQQWDSEYKIKRKKGKFYVNKKRRKQNERRKYDKMRAHEDEWESHRIKNARIIYPDSYQSHEDYNNYYPKQSYRKGPRLPECDFDT